MPDFAEVHNLGTGDNFYVDVCELQCIYAIPYPPNAYVLVLRTGEYGPIRRDEVNAYLRNWQCVPDLRGGYWYLSHHGEKRIVWADVPDIGNKE